MANHCIFYSVYGLVGITLRTASRTSLSLHRYLSSHEIECDSGPVFRKISAQARFMPIEEGSQAQPSSASIRRWLYRLTIDVYSMTQGTALKLKKVPSTHGQSNALCNYDHRRAPAIPMIIARLVVASDA